MSYKIENGKVYNEEGKVAVLYSPGYGAGWYSWNTDIQECLFDPDCVMGVINNNLSDVKDIAESKWEDGYWGGSSDLQIKWLTPGTSFRISEYDGYESVHTSYDEQYVVA